MSERYTRKDAEGALERLAAACGKRVASDYTDKGAWTLDHEPNGYVVYELMESGGCGEPFGSRRRSARDFWEACHFACRAIEALKGAS